MAKTRAVEGYVERVNVQNNSVTITTADGKTQDHPYEEDANLANYWRFIPFTSQSVKCVLENEMVKELTLLSAPQAVPQRR